MLLQLAQRIALLALKAIHPMLVPAAVQFFVLLGNTAMVMHASGAQQAHSTLPLEP